MVREALGGGVLYVLEVLNALGIKKALKVLGVSEGSGGYWTFWRLGGI